MEQLPERSRDLREWHRDFHGRKIAGVCAGIASQLGWSVTAVRAGFILLTLAPPFHGLGVWLYLILWFLMPAEPGRPSGLDQVSDVINGVLGDGSRRRSRDEWSASEDPGDPAKR